MGQAKRRGTYEQRVAQAHVANATLRLSLGETASPILRRFMDKHGLQKFRMLVGKHFFHEEMSTSFKASNESVNTQNESRKQSLVDSIMHTPNESTKNTQPKQSTTSNIKSS